MEGLSILILYVVLLSGEMATSSETPFQAFIRTDPSAQIILPLVLSPANYTIRTAVLRNRSLRDEDLLVHRARMPLFDDLFTNGYYTTRLYIGTPPQEFALIVDTGSTVTYVPCSTCAHCGRHQDPRFKPDHSSTYDPLLCATDCTCDNKKNQCTYQRNYAEMSSSSGLLARDIISFGKESDLKPQIAVFGCENSETGDLFNQRADGIMGLGRGRLSIIDQLVDKGSISNSFSLCYGGMDIGGGAMILGEMPTPDGMVFTHSNPSRSPYYNVDLKEIHVAGKPLSLNPKIFDGNYGTVLDSGTTFAYLPRDAFRAFKDSLTKNLRSLKKINGPDPNFKDICFTGAGRDLSKSFPEVAMIFGNGKMLKLSPENYLFRHSTIVGAYCLGIFQNGEDPTTLLGGIIVRNTLVTYDRKNRSIGFWKTNCSKLLDKLHTSKDDFKNPPLPTPPPPTPPPPPPPTLTPPSTIFTNSTIEAVPGLSPNASKGDFLPGQIEVGIITFDMLLNLAYSSLLPHTNELVQLIARDLDVNPNQVHLMELTSKGNNTLIKLAISPANSSDFISNGTAMGIITRITEHRFRLPEIFGSYEVVQWKVEPPSRRSWRQRHLWAVGLAISVAAMLSMAAISAWYLASYNKPSSQATYMPVGAAFPEQEMQPL